MKLKSLINGLGAILLGLQMTPAFAQTDIGAPLPADLAAKGKLTVGTYCGYPPFGFTEADQIPRGLDPDIARKLAEFAYGDAAAVDFVCIRPDQRISFLQSGRVDFLLTTLGVTIERAKVIDFSEPYFASTTVFLAKRDVTFSTFDEVADKKIGVSSGTPWISWMERCKPEMDLVQYDSIPGQIEALFAGRVEALLVDSTLGYPMVEQNAKLGVTGPSVDAQGYQWAIGLPKGKEDLANWLNAGIEKMQAEDDFWSILTKYVTSETTLKELANVVRRPGYTPDYSGYLASVQESPVCPE